jgi:hypothetical protein
MALNCSALCIIPPIEHWDAIQTIRSQHDKSYNTWMPHINIIFPFGPKGKFPQYKKEMETWLYEHHITSFRIRLQNFNYNEGSKYLHLEVDIVPSTASSSSLSSLPKGNKTTQPPKGNKTKKNKNSKQKKEGGEKKDEEESHPLFHEFRETFTTKYALSSQSKGDKEETVWRAHLTVGQFPQNEIHKAKETLQTQWQSIDFDVNELALIWRDGSSPFRVVERIQLPSQ